MKITNNTLLKVCLLTALSFSSGLLMAQSFGGQGEPRKPPQEAIDACKSLASGKECGFSSQRGSVTGTCWAPEGKPLACKPNNASAGERHHDKQ
jgi:hypothetical protein